MGCNHCECCEKENNVHENEEEKESKLEIVLYIIAIIFLCLSFIPALANVKRILIVFSILFSGYELLFEGIKNIFKLNFEEDTLMTIAVIAAFCLGEYTESCLVIILYKLGEFLEDRAVDKSNESIKEIVKIKADTANLVKENNEIEVVSVEKIQVDDTILIKPGEKIPVDAIVVSGNSEIDTSAITGESNPVYVKENDELLSGGINLNGALTCRVLRDVKNSTASQIVDLVYEATNNKGKTEKFITKFSKIYTPTVIAIAILIAILPATFGYLDYRTWIMRALIFLVASCPCSLVISIPLSFFTCIGKISKKGMIIKGTKHIENLSKATVVAFDKTGTLTTGKMTIDEMKTFEGFDKEQVLKYIYNLEDLSNHPISTAIKDYAENIQKIDVNDYKEIAGHGLYGKIEGNEVLFGNRKLLDKYNINQNGIIIEENAIYLAINQKIAGYITLTEVIREDCKDITENLNKVGINKTIMLTGDNIISANKVAEKINVTQAKASLLPQEKLAEIEKLKNEKEQVIFIGDGINDSPVLAASNFGIAMGAGTTIASSTADSILISNNIGTLPDIIKTAKRAMNVVKFNIAFSLVVKAIVLILGAIGIAPIWLAILADTGVMFLTVVNAIKNIK